jgi:hypothetical protein
VQPWGWTWIDEAPWGFAPFHYGRWAFVGGIWGWVPGPVVARPVYAPALVVWVGRPGWQLSFSIGTGPAVGWFPLGPREVFVPAFRSSTVYVQRINAPHVTNITQIVNVQREPHRAHYANRSHRDAVTIVPGNVVSGGAPVSRHAYRFAQGQSIGPLPDAAPAPAIAPPQRRERMAAPAPVPSRMPQEQTGSQGRRGGAEGGAPRGVTPSAPESRSVVPRHAAPAPTQDAAPSQRRSTTRDAGPSPRAMEPPREERKGEPVRERRDDGRDRGSKEREGGRGGRPGPN